jgi:hypothetical protein
MDAMPTESPVSTTVAGAPVALRDVVVLLTATHCAVCRRKPTDPLSAQLGIGPTCRKRTGFENPDGPQDWPQALVWLDQIQVDGWEPKARASRAMAERDARGVARALVVAIAAEPALEQRNAYAVGALRAVGFGELADRLARRLPDAVQLAVFGVVVPKPKRGSKRASAKAPNAVSTASPITEVARAALNGSLRFDPPVADAPTTVSPDAAPSTPAYAAGGGSSELELTPDQLAALSESKRMTLAFARCLAPSRQPEDRAARRLRRVLGTLGSTASVALDGVRASGLVADVRPAGDAGRGWDLFLRLGDDGPPETRLDAARSLYRAGFRPYMFDGATGLWFGISSHWPAWPDNS